MTSEEFKKQHKRPERDVQRGICEYLTLMKIPFSVTDATAVLNLQGKRVASKARKGWPDITAVLSRGKALFVEVKSTTGRVRPEQQAVHDMLKQQGAIVIVARSVEDVERFVGGYQAAYHNPLPDGISIPNNKNWKAGKSR